MIRLPVLLLALATCSSQRAAGFWFTDTSLFQPATPQLFGQQQSGEAKQQLQEMATAAAAGGQVELLAKSSEPWLRVEPALVSVAKQTQAQPQQQQQQQEAAQGGALAALQLGQQQQQQQFQCQCDADWLRNQTLAQLNKWLASASVANQMRLLASNSTGAAGNSNSASFGSNSSSANSAETHKRPRDSHHNNHWAAWIRSKAGSSGAQVRTARNKQPPPASSQQQQQLASAKQAERGPQGPKGEQGARGERGQSGLLSVKDRNALFDLPAPVSVGAGGSSERTTTSGSNSSGDKQAAAAATAPGQPNEQQQQQEQIARLVFIEAEQMLVVRTEAGWRPVQLLAPLRDFRKAIAKFSLSSAAQRRRLLAEMSSSSASAAAASSSASSAGGRRRAGGGGAGADNSIKPLRRHHSGAALAATRGALADSDRSQNELMAYASAGRADDGGDGDDDEADEDEDEDDEDDEDDEEDDDDDDDDEDDDDGDEADDMEDNNEVGGGNDLQPPSRPLVGGQAARRTMATSGANQAPSSSQSPQPPSTSSQVVAGRSATAAALVSASIGSGGGGDSSAGAKLQPTPADESAASARRSNGGASDKRIMKLRMAALNEPFSGNVHGIRGADFECKRNAAKANVKGSFRAFLAAGFQSLNEVVRLNVHKYPIVNLRGETLANSWHDLFKQPARIANPLSRIYSFDGRHVATDSKWPNKLVWHGAANKAGYRDLVQNCDGWHSDSLNKFGLATPIHSPRLSGGHASTMKARRQRKRHLAELAANNGRGGSSNQTSLALASGDHQQAGFLEGIEKYPCRMPLVVLCIETIGQHFSEHQWSGRRFGLATDGAEEASESNNVVPPVLS